MTATKNEALRIAIVGAGTAGSAAALLLHRAGHTVTVFERVPDPGPVGAGIILQPTGMAVLDRLGLLPPVWQRGAPLAGLRCQTSGGRVLLDLRYERLAPGLHGLGLHRGVLFEALLGALRQTRVQLHTGVEIDRYENGSEVWLHQGNLRHGPYELLVVADGAQSRLRAQHPGLRKAARYPWGALWWVGPDTAGCYQDALHQVVEGTHRMYGLLPSGLGPAPNQKPLVSLYWSLRGDQVERWRQGDFSGWKKEALRYDSRSASILEQIPGPESLLFAAYHDVVMRPWHHGSVVFLGDAAHAMSPQLGQGCNLALMDAEVLARAVAETSTPRLAVAAYSSARRRHLNYYQRATRWLTPFFQSDFSALSLPRDIFLGFSRWFPYAERAMLESMTGCRRGFIWAESMPLAAPVLSLPRSV